MGPEDTYWKLVEEFRDDPAVEESTMMGHDCLRINGDFFGMIDGRGQLIVKVPAGRVDEIVGDGLGENVAPAGRVFREWVAIPAANEDLWQELLLEARDFVGNSA